MIVSKSKPPIMPPIVTSDDGPLLTPVRVVVVVLHRVRVAKLRR